MDSLCGRVGVVGVGGLGKREILRPFFLSTTLPLQSPADSVLRRLADGRRGIMWKRSNAKENSPCESRFFVHFFAITARLQRETA